MGLLTPAPPQALESCARLSWPDGYSVSKQLAFSGSMVNLGDSCRKCGPSSTKILSCAIWLLSLIKSEILVIGRWIFMWEKGGKWKRGRQGDQKNQWLHSLLEVNVISKHWRGKGSVSMSRSDALGLCGAEISSHTLLVPSEDVGMKWISDVSGEEMPWLLILPETRLPHEKETSSPFPYIGGRLNGCLVIKHCVQ